MNNEFAVRRLDVRSFAEEAGELGGEQPLDNFGRLVAETDPGRTTGAAVSWSARGELRNPGHVQPEVWLHLKARALLPLTCQRCLGPVEVGLDVNRSFRFVADENQAAIEDEHSEEDVLALDGSFDLVALLEDELLMELPAVPRHEVCPEPVQLAAADAQFEEANALRVHPFAQLEKLKTGRH